MEIIKIERSTNGHKVLVWYKSETEVYYDSQAISRAMTLDILMDSDVMDHVNYLIQKHYQGKFQQEAKTTFEEEKRRKAKKLVKSILTGNFAAAKWLHSHKAIARDSVIQEEVRAFKKNGTIKAAKLEKLDPTTKGFIKDAFHIQ